MKYLFSLSHQRASLLFISYRIISHFLISTKMEPSELLLLLCFGRDKVHVCVCVCVCVCVWGGCVCVWGGGVCVGGCVGIKDNCRTDWVWNGADARRRNKQTQIMKGNVGAAKATDDKDWMVKILRSVLLLFFKAISVMDSKTITEQKRVK